MIVAALSAQLRYVQGLAARNSDPEALGRNVVWAVEIRQLIDKVK